MSKSYPYTTSFTYDGKRYNVSAHTEQELWQKKALKLRDLEEGKVTIGPNMTVQSWAEMALSTYKPNVSASVMRDMKTRIGKHIYEAIGSMPIRSVRPMHCQQIMNRQIGMSFSHIKKLAQELKFIFQTAVDNKLILESPAAHIVIPDGTKGRRRSLTENEERHFLSVCSQDDRFILFELMYYCGCRPSEAANAIGKDFDAKTKLLHIRGTKTINSDRSVPVPDVFIPKLINIPPFDYIAKNRTGKRIDEGSYKRAVKALERAMNISMGAKTYRNALVPPLPLAPDFVPYDLRHTYCTNLAKAGVDVRTAQRLMGHASIQMTADIYTHIDFQQIAQAGDLLQKYYNAK